MIITKVKGNQKQITSAFLPLNSLQALSVLITLPDRSILNQSYIITLGNMSWGDAVRMYVLSYLKVKEFLNYVHCTAPYSHLKCLINTQERRHSTFY